jgi:hypothetical protein
MGPGKSAQPRVIRVHTTVELTRATIEKCPPTSPPEGLRSLLAADGVGSVDLHRYRARLNLTPGRDAKAASEGVTRAIEAAWGPPAPLPGEPPPRAFGVEYEGPRMVTESPEMAAPDATLVALFRVPLVAEAILEAGRYGSGRAACSPGRTWRPRSAGLCRVPSGAALPCVSQNLAAHFAPGHPVTPTTEVAREPAEYDVTWPDDPASRGSPRATR